MGNFAKEIIPVHIEEELKRSYLDYAMSVIVGRALPDVRDGLKPVHRRILFAMKMLGNDWNKPYKKSARIVGDVIGKYHPHGDAAVYDSIVRMAQSFSLRYTLIDGQGNFGSIDGDPAAAMRYTEVRMSKIAHELLSDIDKETVNYSTNYDGTEYIPDVMPTIIPNLLINGSSGIAVGMATNIPPHNLCEVIDGCLAYIKDENISIEELMQYIPGPDFPTAAIINGQNGIKDAYRTGQGKIYIRAKVIIESAHEKNNESIIINELPYQVNKSKLIEKIVSLIKEKRIDGINNIRDESDKEGMRIVIEIKKDTTSQIVLNNLYSLTQLQTTFGINMVALHEGVPKLLSLKDIIVSFIQHRRNIVIRRIIFELNKANNRILLLEALIIAILHIDLVINMIKESSTPEEARKNLLQREWDIDPSFLLKKELDFYTDKKESLPQFLINSKYFLNDKQVQAILDLRLQKLTNLEKEKLLSEYKNLIIYISDLNQTLRDSNKLMRVIRNELCYIKEKYRDTRRTQINIEVVDTTINIENLVNQENVVITLSHQGYVKYQPLTDYEAQHRGGRGKSAARTKQEDFIDRLLVANTHDTILLFSNRGRIYWMKVYQLPEASRISKGKPIINLLPLEINERITAILPVNKYKNKKYVFMVTARGIVKKTDLSEFSRPRSTGIIAVNLIKGDELIGVDVTNGTDEIMLFSAYGKVVRFPEDQVRNTHRTTSGIRGIHLSKNDKVVSIIIPNNQASILIITKNGYGKRTKQIAFSTKSRATKGIISIKVNERNGEVVGAVQVNNEDQILIITDAGTLVRTRVSEINIIGRNTQGVMLIRTTKCEHVVGLQRIPSPYPNSTQSIDIKDQ
ncbi:DNA topoisomerase (ATP-hydrolyzing) subunit A [Candidatus Schneideria nysicola]|nr:DNA topoisomerase (ATP-hydrolyzing) subunit A [Candidatus Schneideria nysicola]